VKVGGVRFNLGKRGVSTSIGGRGHSITFSSRGTIANVGLPGTGISWSSKLANGGRHQPSSSSSLRTTTKTAINIAVADDGSIRYEYDNGNPVEVELIKLAKKQHREAILAMLEVACGEINGKIEKNLNVHLKTLPPNLNLGFTPGEFSVAPPVAPDPIQFTIPRPTAPIPPQKNLLTRNIGFLSKQADEKAQRLSEQYLKDFASWEIKQKDLEDQLSRANEAYGKALATWLSQKNVFDQAEAQIRLYIEEGIIPDNDVMKSLLEDHFSESEWPLETNIGFDIRDDGRQIWLDIDLPEIEMLPSKTAKVNSSRLNLTVTELTKSQIQKNYLTHIHSIGFRVLGEAFAVLPSAHEAILSGYSQRVNVQTGQVEDQYLYSVVVQRDQWEKINFDNLASIDVVDVFGLFNLRRKVNKQQGKISPIDPFVP
jgi:hypothetical protein